MRLWCSASLTFTRFTCTTSANTPQHLEYKVVPLSTDPVWAATTEFLGHHKCLEELILSLESKFTQLKRAMNSQGWSFYRTKVSRVTWLFYSPETKELLSNIRLAPMQSFRRDVALGTPYLEGHCQFPTMALMDPSSARLRNTIDGEIGCWGICYSLISTTLRHMPPTRIQPTILFGPTTEELPNSELPSPPTTPPIATSQEIKTETPSPHTPAVTEDASPLRGNRKRLTPSLRLAPRRGSRIRHRPRYYDQFISDSSPPSPTKRKLVFDNDDDDDDEEKTLCFSCLKSSACICNA